MKYFCRSLQGIGELESQHRHGASETVLGNSVPIGRTDIQSKDSDLVLPWLWTLKYRATFTTSEKVVIYECSTVPQSHSPQTMAAGAVSGVQIPWPQILPGTQALRELCGPNPFSLFLPSICQGK